MPSCCIQIRRLLIVSYDGVESHGSARGGPGASSTVICHNPGEGESYIRIQGSSILQDATRAGLRARACGR